MEPSGSRRLKRRQGVAKVAEIKPIGTDISGYPLLKDAVKALLNAFPGMGSKEILFEELGRDEGLAFSADSGALIMSERRSITDHVVQTCQFPFFVVFKKSPTREFQFSHIASFLDALGKWICKEPVEIDGETHQLKAYPALSNGRQITRITRSNFYGTTPEENKSQNWILPVMVQYTYEFDM